MTKPLTIALPSVHGCASETAPRTASRRPSGWQEGRATQLRAAERSGTRNPQPVEGHADRWEIHERTRENGFNETPDALQLLCGLIHSSPGSSGQVCR